MAGLFFDAEGLVAGRLASIAAKQLLKGNKVTIVNASKAIVSGRPSHTFEIYSRKVKMGDPYHGPFFPRGPERILRRTVKSMLPQSSRGRSAVLGLSVHSGTPKLYEGKKFEKPAAAEAGNITKFATLSRVSKQIGGKG